MGRCVLQMRLRHALKVSTGEYDVGDDSIPNASPRHRRHLESFWIDSEPVSWAHFETFVAGGGYGDESLWTDAAGNPTSTARPTSVDAHHRQLLSLGRGWVGRRSEGRTREQPITGLSWFEAGAIARFYGARLPFE